MLKEGFYCALGTPLDEEGNIVQESLIAHIESQIEAGASGLLLMGTMGMFGCIRDSQYERVIKIAVAVHPHFFQFRSFCDGLGLRMQTYTSIQSIL
jgi:dihydrodipicolinate synthase/N-acetylneuraminate lyase